MYRLTLAIFVLFQIVSLIDAKPNKKNVTMPSACEGKTYCLTKHKDYPKKLIEDLLHEDDSLNGSLYQGRIGGDYIHNDCETSVSIGPIYEILDQNDEVRFVAQSFGKFRQIVGIEECRYPGRIVRPTYNFSYDAIATADFYCADHYQEQKFVVLSLNTTSLELVALKGGLPISCTCERQESH